MDAKLIKQLKDMSNAGLMDCKKALEATNGDIDEAIKYLREKGISKAAKKADRVAVEGLSNIIVDGNNAVIYEVNCETDFVSANEKFKTLVDVIGKTLINGNATTLEEALSLPTEDGTLNDTIINVTATMGEKISLRRFTKLTKTDSQNFGDYIHMGGKIAVLTVIEGANQEVAKDVAMHSAAMRPQYVKSSDVPTEALEEEMKIIKEQLLNEGKPEKIIEERIMPGKVEAYYSEVCLENQVFVKAENGETVAKFVENNGGEIISMIRYEVGEGMEKKEENFVEEVMNQIKG